MSEEDGRSAIKLTTNRRDPITLHTSDGPIVVTVQRDEGTRIVIVAPRTVKILRQRHAAMLQKTEDELIAELISAQAERLKTISGE